MFVMSMRISNFKVSLAHIHWLQNRAFPLLALLLASGLYFYELDAESLWRDEFYSIRDAQNIDINALRVRPLYYLCLNLWMHFGSGDVWLRSLSVLFAIASVPLMYWLSRRLVGSKAAILATLLFVLSPECIDHAQEVRMYMLGVFLSLGGSLALTYALEQPKQVWMGIWILARYLVMLTTPLNLLILLPDGLLVLTKFHRQPSVLKKFSLWLGGLGIAWLPFGWSLMQASEKFAGDWASEIQRNPIASLVRILVTFTVGMGDIPLAEFSWSQKVFFFSLSAVLVGLIAVALFRQKFSSRLWWLAAWVFLPSLTILVYSYARHSLLINRYLLFMCPYVFILLAVGFIRIWNWKPFLGIILATLYLIGVTSGLRYHYTVQTREAWRDAVQIINQQKQPGDVISVYSNDLAVDYYYQGKEPIYKLALDSNKKKVGKEDFQKLFTDLPAIESRLWIIYRNRGREKHDFLFRQALEESFKINQHHDLPKIELFLTSRQN